VVVEEEVVGMVHVVEAVDLQAVEEPVVAGEFLSQVLYLYKSLGSYVSSVATPKS
jgi:hypothetical protein